MSAVFQAKEETPMKLTPGLLRTAAVLVVVLSNLLLGFVQRTTNEFVRIDRSSRSAS